MADGNALRTASFATRPSLNGEAGGRPGTGKRPNEGQILGTMPSGGTRVEIPSYSAYLPEPGVTASIESMALYAGQSCSLVHDIKPAAQIVRDVMKDAEIALQRIVAA